MSKKNNGPSYSYSLQTDPKKRTKKRSFSLSGYSVNANGELSSVSYREDEKRKRQHFFGSPSGNLFSSFAKLITIPVCLLLVLSFLLCATYSGFYISPSDFISTLQNWNVYYHPFDTIQRFIRAFSRDGGTFGTFVIDIGIAVYNMARDISSTFSSIGYFLSPSNFTRPQSSYQSAWEWSVPPAPSYS